MSNVIGSEVTRPRARRFKPRDLAVQVIVLAIVLGGGGYLAFSTVDALTARGINVGTAFLFSEAGFRVSENLIPYQPSDSIGRAIFVGFLNTLKVSLFSLVAATIIGLLVGIGQMADNRIVRAVCTTYVAAFRNTPQLVQISFLYLLLTRLPGPRDPIDIGAAVFLSNRGIAFAWLPDTPQTGILSAVLVISLIAGLAWGLFVRGYRRRTGRKLPVWPVIAGLIVLPVLFAWLGLGRPTAIEFPALKGFNIRGGVTWSTEFLTLFLGLSLYIAAFIAEIVRSGIQATTQGQLEAAQSIGLSKADILSKVVLPQAMRVMTPPLTAQYVSLMKNSSLGVMIGYPELFNISSTALTLSGHVIECLVIMAGLYLATSLAISALGNAVNRAFRTRER